MADETLAHAIRRVIRFVKIDDTSHGGLLSKDTLLAVNRLETLLLKEESNGNDED